MRSQTALIAAFLAALGSAMLVGFLGYGISFVLFVLALRGLGASRTGAYYSTAPFFGAAIAIAFFHEPLSIAFWIACALMSAGVWLHLTERHEHEHTHNRSVTRIVIDTMSTIGMRCPGTARNRIHMNTSTSRLRTATYTTPTFITVTGTDNTAVTLCTHKARTAQEQGRE